MRPGDNDEVIGSWQVVLRQTKGLAEQTLEAIAAYGWADAARHDDPQARMGQIIRQGVECQRAAGLGGFAGEDGGEGPPAVEAMGAGKAAGGSHGFCRV